MTDIIEQAARVMHEGTRPRGAPVWDEADECEQGVLRDSAQALAAAGLLSPRTITPEQRDDLARLNLANSVETITDAPWQWVRHQECINAILAELNIEVSR